MYFLRMVFVYLQVCLTVLLSCSNLKNIYPDVSLYTFIKWVAMCMSIRIPQTRFKLWNQENMLLFLFLRPLNQFSNRIQFHKRNISTPWHNLHDLSTSTLFNFRLKINFSSKCYTLKKSMLYSNKHLLEHPCDYK